MTYLVTWKSIAFSDMDLQTCVEADNADAAQVKAEAEAPEEFKAVYYVDYLYMRELTTIKSTKLDSSSVHVAEVHDGTQCADRKTWDLLRDIYTPSDAEQKLHHQISETLFRLAGELAEEERRRNE